MSEIIIIPAGQNLISEVVTHLQSADNNFGRSIVVFPGKRPAHFVRKALADRAGGTFIPPRIFSIDSFIEYLVTDRLRVTRRVLENLDAVAILFDIHSSLSEHLGGDHFATVDRFVALGLKLFSEIEELTMADVPLRRLIDALPGVPLGRVHSLPGYYERFYAAVEEKGFTTRALNYRTLSESIGSIDFNSLGRIILAGFFAYTPLEQRIFRSLLARDNTVFIAQQGPGIQKHLQTIGIDAAAGDGTDAPVSPECFFYKASDIHGQVFAASRGIKTMLDAHEEVNERTVIVLLSADALFPVVHQTLPLLPHEQYNIALGYPLQRTPLSGFLNGLMNLSAKALNGRVPAADYTSFVLHPYTKNILFGQRADVTRVLFHTIETHLARAQSSLFVDLKALEEENAIFDSTSRSLTTSGIDATIPELKDHLRTIHNETIRKFLQIDSLGDFARKATEVVQYIHRHSTATRHPMFRPYAERFTEVLETISNSLLAMHRLVDPAAYVTFLRNLISAEEVPFPGTPLKGLQVLGLLETRNLSFDTVFLLNATDDVIPGARGQNVLLPQRLREQLGLDTYADREKLIEYYFTSLLAGARTVHCYFMESGSSEKSRFLEKLLWEEQKRKNVLDEGDSVRVVRYKVDLSASRPAAIAKSPMVVEHLSRFEFTSSALDSYLQCPLQFYYRHVLRLSEKDEVAEDLDQREIGSFVHLVLKAYFEHTVNRPLAPDDLDRGRLHELIDLHFEKEYGGDLVGPTYLVKQQIIRQLDAFLAGYQAPMLNDNPITLLALEQDVSITLHGRNYSGRIDRIEKRGKRYIILDYKTGRDDKYIRINPARLDVNNPSTWRDAIGSFQLPMYMLLYSHWRKVPVSQISPAYLFLGRNGITRDVEVGLGSDAFSPEQIFQSVQPVIAALAGQILDPEIAFEPTDRLDQVCPQCPYKAICGTAWVG